MAPRLSQAVSLIHVGFLVTSDFPYLINLKICQCLMEIGPTQFDPIKLVNQKLVIGGQNY